MPKRLRIAGIERTWCHIEEEHSIKTRIHVFGEVSLELNLLNIGGAGPCCAVRH